MKWLFLLGLLALIIPICHWLRQKPENAAWIWTLFGFLAVQHGPLHCYMAMISWADWPGYVKGAELSLVDVLALSLYCTLPRTKHPFPYKVTAGLYIVAVLVSALHAQNVEPALFPVWQLSRILFTAVVLNKAVALNYEVLLRVLRGMVYGLALALVNAAWEHLSGHILQANGAFQSQNQLGMMTHFVTFPFLALLLAGGRGKAPALVPIAGGVIAVLTASRATLGIIGVGYAALFFLSVLRGLTPRKTTVALLGMFVAGVLGFAAITALETRLGSQHMDSALQEDEERKAFKNAAAMMLDDYPMGVGANHFVVVANSQGYYDRANVVPTPGSRGAHVHNVYWLVAAETGYLGLFAFLPSLAQPLLLALRICNRSSSGYLSASSFSTCLESPSA